MLMNVCRFFLFCHWPSTGDISTRKLSLTLTDGDRFWICKGVFKLAQPCSHVAYTIRRVQ